VKNEKGACSGVAFGPEREGFTSVEVGEAHVCGEKKKTTSPIKGLITIVADGGKRARGVPGKKR